MLFLLRTVNDALRSFFNARVPQKYDPYLAMAITSAAMITLVVFASAPWKPHPQGSPGKDGLPGKDGRTVVVTEYPNPPPGGPVVPNHQRRIRVVAPSEPASTHRVVRPSIVPQKPSGKPSPTDAPSSTPSAPVSSPPPQDTSPPTAPATSPPPVIQTQTSTSEPHDPSVTPSSTQD